MVSPDIGDYKQKRIDDMGEPIMPFKRGFYRLKLDFWVRLYIVMHNEEV